MSIFVPKRQSVVSEVIDATPEAVGDTQKPLLKSLVMLTSIAPVSIFTTLVESTQGLFS